LTLPESFDGTGFIDAAIVHGLSADQFLWPIQRRLWPSSARCRSG
jgi:hypothetical protein